MKYYPVPQLTGINPDTITRNLADGELIDAINFYFKEGRGVIRYGYSQLGSNVLNGAVTGLAYYKHVLDVDAWLVATTRYDTYYYDSANSLWKFLTNRVMLGTVTTSAKIATLTGVTRAGDDVNGSTTVTLTGGAVTTNITTGMTIAGTGIVGGSYVKRIISLTELEISTAASSSNSTTFTFTWNNTLWNGTTYYIKFDTTDPNAAGTWYPGVFTSGTVFTSPDTLPAKTNASYVIRLCWQGGDTDRHRFVYPLETSTYERSLFITNGMDYPQIWDGVGSWPQYVYTARRGKYVEDYVNHVFLGNLATDSMPQVVDNSATGTPRVWSGGSSGITGLFQGDDEITWLKNLSNKLVAYKKNSATIFNFTGDIADPFMYDEQVINKGVDAGGATVDIGNAHIILTNDNFYLFDGINMKEIGENVNGIVLSEFNKSKSNVVHSMDEYRNNLYIMWYPITTDYPDKAVVLKYNSGGWSWFDFADQITANGKWKQTSSNTWQMLIALGTTWEDYGSGRWIDEFRSATDFTYVLGDSNGYVYEFDTSKATDDGTDIDATFTTKDYPLNDPEMAFRLSRCVVSVTTAMAGQMQVSASTDFGVNWQTVTIDLTTSSNIVDYVANFILHGNQVRFRVNNVDGSLFTVESMMAMFDDMGFNLNR